MQNIVALVFEEKVHVWISNIEKWFLFAIWMGYFYSRKRMCSL